MKYLINGRDISDLEFNNSLNAKIEHVARIELNQMLDNIYGDICIENCTLYASEIFEKCRPKEYIQLLRDRVATLNYEIFGKVRLGIPVTLIGVEFRIKE